MASDVIKFTGKLTGDILKPLGLEKFCEGTFNAAAATNDFASGATTLDKKEIKQSLKDLENSAEMAVESKIFKQIEKYGKKAVEETWEFHAKALEKTYDFHGDIARKISNETGRVFEKIGLDGVGKGIRSAGKLTDGLANLEGSLYSFDKDAVKKGLKDVGDGAEDAWDSHVEITQNFYDTYGEMSRKISNAGGDLLKKIGLKSFGEGIKAIGRFTDSLTNIEGGLYAIDKDMMKEGLKT